MLIPIACFTCAGEGMAPQLKTAIDSLIQTNKVVVFMKVRTNSLKLAWAIVVKRRKIKQQLQQSANVQNCFWGNHTAVCFSLAMCISSCKATSAQV
jgi:hypothetical protein